MPFTAKSGSNRCQSARRAILGFLEPTATAVGARVLSVDANGVNRIAGLDVLQAAGARKTAIVRSFPLVVTNGEVALDFKGVVGKAIVSNIAIVKQ